MATRSTIAMEFDDGTIKQVYCHWDGYLDHNGKILQEHYSDKAKLKELISLGSISSLGTTIGEKHPFYGPSSRNITTFYRRDRGDKNVGYNKYTNFKEYTNDGRFEEYNYILRNDGNWYVAYDDSFVLLSEALAR